MIRKLFAVRHRLSAILLILLLFSFTGQSAVTVPVVVKVRAGANLSLVTNLLGGTLIDAIPEANTYLLSLPGLPVLSPTLKLLGVEWLELDRGVSLPADPPLALLDVPWNAGGDWYKAQPALQLIRSEAALQYATGRGLIVADINSRIDYGHPALAGHVGAGYDFVANRPSGVAALNDDQSTAGFLDDDQSTAGFLDDDQSTAGFLDGSGISLSTLGLTGTGAAGHGTFCAALIAVTAPDATIMPLRAFDDNGNSDLFTLAKAIRYARRNGAQVLNMSFGTLTDARVLREAINDARAGNVLLVASAGNNNTSSPQYPAAYPGVIAVAATDLLDRKTSFSNYGGYVFVDAPGSHIISALPDGRYGIANGTSFSAPMVAGMAAVIRSVRYSDTAAIIAGSAVPIDSRNPWYAGQLGYGRIDTLKAARTAREGR
jgi:subtilisin family serine protease